jgi:hypothetical protein
MARIGNDRVIVRGEQRPDDSWLFTIRYTIHFDQSELGQRFDDSVGITENGPVSASATPVSFVACSPFVFRKKRVVVGAAGEPLHDEVYATVRVHRSGGTEAGDVEQRTAVVLPTLRASVCNGTCRASTGAAKYRPTPSRALQC